MRVIWLATNLSNVFYPFQQRTQNEWEGCDRWVVGTPPLIVYQEGRPAGTMESGQSGRAKDSNE
jgi:hypothetical protein